MLLLCLAIFPRLDCHPHSFLWQNFPKNRRRSLLIINFGKGSSTWIVIHFSKWQIFPKWIVGRLFFFFCKCSKTRILNCGNIFLKGLSHSVGKFPRWIAFKSYIPSKMLIVDRSKVLMKDCYETLATFFQNWILANFPKYGLSLHHGNISKDGLLHGIDNFP